MEWLKFDEKLAKKLKTGEYVGAVIDGGELCLTIVKIYSDKSDDFETEASWDPDYILTDLVLPKELISKAKKITDLQFKYDKKEEEIRVLQEKLKKLENNLEEISKEIGELI